MTELRWHCSKEREVPCRNATLHVGKELQMKRTKWIALVAAVAATIAVWQIMRNQMRQQEAELDYREVIVAAEEIRRGEVIQRGKLGVRKVPRQYTPVTAVERAGDVLGKVAQSAIAPGEMITPERLSNPESGQAGLAYKIPDENRAITLTVGVESGVAGMILPGNRVDILVSLPDTTDSVPAEAEQVQEVVNAASTIYLLEDVYVLACGRSMSADEAERIASESGQYIESVTLSVTPEEARQVELYTYTASQNSGNVRLVLRPAVQEDAETGNLENDVEEQS